MSEDIGVSITSATRFLYQIRADIFSMLSALNSTLSDSGWKEAKRSAVSSEHPIRHNFRMYIPQAADDTAAEIIGILVELDPPPTLNEAVVLAVHAVFDPTRPVREIWNAWLHEGCRRVLEANGLTTGMLSLTSDALKPDFMPFANHAQILVTPLARMNGSDALIENLAKPIIAAATASTGSPTAG